MCAGLPESAESTTVHHPSFKIRGKTFAIYAESDGVPAAWIKSTHGEQQELIRSDPERFFAPPYLGPRGWVAVRLDGTCDWGEVAEVVADGWKLAAPKRLARQFDEQQR